MPLPAYLVRNRLGIFYLRVVLPRAVRLSYPALPREIRRSLRTHDPQVARTAARRFAAAYDLFLQSTRMEEAMRYDSETSQWLIGKTADGRLQIIRQAGDDPNNLAVIIRTMIERHFREIIAPDEKTAEKRTVVIDGKTVRIFDIPVADIGAEQIRAFKAAMANWPKGFGQGARGDAKDPLTAKDAVTMTHLKRQSAGNAIKSAKS
jgi:hypothetical protein